MADEQDALGEILAQRQQTQDDSFEAHQGDVIAEIIRRPQIVDAGGGAEMRVPGPRELAMVPNVSEASKPLGFGTSVLTGLVDDLPTKLRIVAEKMFPDDPQAVRRFGFIDGQIVFVNDQGQLERAQGGFRDWLGGMVGGPGPAIAGGIIGSAAGPEGTVAGATGAAALGAAAGEAYRKIAGAVLLDEPQTTMGNVGAIATEGALSGAGALIGGGVSALRGRAAIKGLEDLDVATANAQRDAIRTATGIELDLAQVTNNPKLKALKTWASNFPGVASEIMKANSDLVRGQVDSAIQRILTTISKEPDTATQGLRGINAASAAIETAKLQVSAKAGPLYRQAFAEGASVDPQPVVTMIEEMLSGAKGSQASTLRRALSYFYTGKGEERALDTSLEGLHATKLALDEMLERRGSSSLGRTTYREVVRIKNALVEAMGEASPTYKSAMDTFASETARLVDPLQQSVVGVLAQVDDLSAATAAAKIFNAGNVTPQMVMNARTAIEAAEKANPRLEGAWNGLVRQWLSRNFVRAAAESPSSGVAANLAGKFRAAVVGTDTQKRALVAALEPRANAPPTNTLMMVDDVLSALRMVSRTPTSSSATEFNRLLTQELSPGGSIIRGVTQPRKTLIEGIQQRVLERNAKAIAEALTDPSKVSQLRALQGISDAQQRATIAASVIGLISAGEAGRSVLFPPGTEIPPALLDQPQ